MKFFGFFGQLRLSNIANIVYRILQFVVGLVIVGMYGRDLNAAREQGKYSDTKWQFAVAAGAIGAGFALFLIAIGAWRSYTLVAWFCWLDGLTTVMYAVLAGMFGAMYWNENIEMDEGIRRMKTAVGFDIAGVVLWCISCAVGAYCYLKGRAKTRAGPKE